VRVCCSSNICCDKRMSSQAKRPSSPQSKPQGAPPHQRPRVDAPHHLVRAAGAPPPLPVAGGAHVDLPHGVAQVGHAGGVPAAAGGRSLEVRGRRERAGAGQARGGDERRLRCRRLRFACAVVTVAACSVCRVYKLLPAPLPSLPEMRRRCATVAAPRAVAGGTCVGAAHHRCCYCCRYLVRMCMCTCTLYATKSRGPVSSLRCFELGVVVVIWQRCL